jgi:succinoglycan biosynthesis transport protein ExoP
LREALYSDEQSGLAFLPAVIESRLAHSSEILGSEAFRQLIEGLRKSYDYIVIDFPPLAPVVDVRATTNLVDSYVFVIEWGRTRLNMVQRQLGSAPELFDRLLGVVLNKANIRVLERYEDYYGRYYYKKNYYARYGYTK